jgi:malate/lactate dehydrogenase
MSPANAIKDHIRDWFRGTDPGDFVSKAVILDEVKYGVPKGMCFSLPVECKDFDFNVVDFPIDQFTRDKINRSIEEISKELTSVGFKL